MFKNFKLLEKNIYVDALYKDVLAQPELWNADTFRTSYPGSPMKNVDDILIRFPNTNKYNDKKGKDTPQIFHDDTTQVWYSAYEKLPSLRPLIASLMFKFNVCNLHRVLLVKNKPGTGFGAHKDIGDTYVSIPNAKRYYLVVNGKEGNMIRCGDESVSMHTGELWWFNANEEHESMNISNEDRIHLMLDFEFFP